eukprot:1290219-Rhodomonas_salina.1
MATCWITRSLTLSKNNKANTHEWSTLFDKISQELEIDSSAAEVPVHHNTPTKAQPLLTDGAGCFYTMDHLQKAFFLCQQCGNQPMQPKGGGTPPSGKPGGQRLCPVCKVTHPGWLQTCPVWDSQTKAIVEENSAKREAQQAKICGSSYLKKKTGDKTKVVDKSPEQQLLDGLRHTTQAYSAEQLDNLTPRQFRYTVKRDQHGKTFRVKSWFTTNGSVFDCSDNDVTL